MPKLIERKTTNSVTIEDYKKFSKSIYTSVKKLGKKLKGKTVIHINATPVGGGVAELLSSQIGLERSLGIDSRWFYLDAPPNFFTTTKKIHNLLQGMPGRLFYHEQDTYQSTNEELAKSLIALSSKVKPDIIVVHDAQPLTLVKTKLETVSYISRLHVDLSEANPWIIKYINPYLSLYSQIIVSSKNFSASLPKKIQKNVKVVMPAIDPMTQKNKSMDNRQAKRIITDLGIDPLRPIVTQVSRFDPWKDPIGVVEAYYMAKEEIPDLQLVLSGIINAKDDPQAWSILEKVRKRVNGDPNIFLFWDIGQLKKHLLDDFINALYTSSTVIIQKSLKEGFGLTVTEAMWKEKAVIGGNAQGIHLQIQNNRNGLIVPNTLKAAKAIIQLIKNPKLRNKIGKAAHKSVGKNFLLPRYILDNLKIYEKTIRS